MVHFDTLLTICITIHIYLIYIELRILYNQVILNVQDQSDFF